MCTSELKSTNKQKYLQTVTVLQCIVTKIENDLRNNKANYDSGMKTYKPMVNLSGYLLDSVTIAQKGLQQTRVEFQLEISALWAFER